MGTAKNIIYWYNTIKATTIAGTSILSGAIASAIQQQNNTNSQNSMTSNHRVSPQVNITGSIQLGPMIKQTILSKVNVPLDKAISIARQAVSQTPLLHQHSFVH